MGKKYFSKNYSLNRQFWVSKMHPFVQMSERSFYYGTNNKAKNKRQGNILPAIRKMKAN